jgi:predicted ATPase
MLQFKEDNSPDEKLHKLEKALERSGLPLSEVLPLFAALLSLPLSNSRYALPTLAPQRQRQKTLEAILTWLLARAEREPVLMVGEDLQWVDPSTLELLSLFIERGSTARILTLFTFRPEFLPPWAMRSHFAQLTLSRLPGKQVEAVIEGVTRGKALPAEMITHIVMKTDGVPLYVEELTKMVLESELLSMGATGRSSLSLAIPTTLSGSLTARLDRLDTAKEVAQLGATLGREFSYELIWAVSVVDEATLRKELGRLVSAELLHQRGVPPQARYLFKHALIQDAAYQSLLKSKRQHYHRQIAQALQERFPETVETQAELLAHHYTEASLFEQAIPYWQKAGQRATERSANTEAISHLTKGLELLKTFSNTPERLQQEIALQIALSAPLIAAKGYTAPELENIYTRARELCQQLGQTPQLFPVLFRLRSFYLVRAELQIAHELGEQLVSLAQSVQDPALLLEAHYALGAALFYLGEFAPAQDHFERMIAIYNPQQYRSHAFLYGQDPGVAALFYAAWSLWYLGYPDQASQRLHEALTLAREVSHPFSLAFAFVFAACFSYFRREEQPTQKWAEAAIALSREQGFPFWMTLAAMLRGWALAKQRQGEEGIAQLHQGLAGQRAMGTELSRPHFLAMLAEAYGDTGQSEEGLAVLAEALAIVKKNGERDYQAADLYQLKGQLTLKRSGVRSSDGVFSRRLLPNAQAETEAEACFLKAIEIAQRQGARSLELRAVMSLARLWRRQGKKAAARQRLARIYGWFTEGFATPDLQAAKVLLNELA